jgi:hypothetical protein
VILAQAVVLEAQIVELGQNVLDPIILLHAALGIKEHHVAALQKLK